MKLGIIFLALLVSGASAHAQVEDSSFYGAGLRLGLGYNFVDYEQKISDTGADFTAGAQEISFLHLAFGTQWSNDLWFLLYGSLGTITYDASPSGPPDQTHTAMTADVNAEARFTFGEGTPKEDWVPVYILGVNATYMSLVRVPQSATAGYEYDLVPLVSPMIGVTTTVWGTRSAWRNTVRVGVPLFCGSGLDVHSGYNLSALTSYTFALGEHTSIGVEGLISYLKLNLSEKSPVTSQDVQHEITEFSVGPRVFFTLGF